MMNFFLAVLFTLRVFARNLQRGIPEEILFVFRFDVWPWVLRLIIQYITYWTTVTLHWCTIYVYDVKSLRSTFQF